MVKQIYDISLVFEEESVRNVMSKLVAISTVMYGVLGLMRRMGLPEEYDQAIIAIQQIISTLNMLRVSLTALIALSATHPIGWAMFAIAAGGTILTLAELGAA